MNGLDGAWQAVFQIKHTRLSSLVHLHVPLCPLPGEPEPCAVLELQRKLQKSQPGGCSAVLAQSGSACTLLCPKVCDSGSTKSTSTTLARISPHRSTASRP